MRQMLGPMHKAQPEEQAVHTNPFW